VNETASVCGTEKQIAIHLSVCLCLVHKDMGLVDSWMSW